MDAMLQGEALLIALPPHTKNHAREKRGRVAGAS